MTFIHQALNSLIGKIFFTFALLSPGFSQAAVNIVVNYDSGFENSSGDPYRRYYEIAEFVWETVLVSRKYSDGTPIPDIVISANLSSSGGPSFASQTGRSTGFDTSTGNPFSYSHGGSVTVQTGAHGTIPLTNFSRAFAWTAIHEMGHSIGFIGGNIWNDLGLTPTIAQYSGANGVSTFLAEYGAAAAGFTYIPLENSTGIAGTDLVHWDGVFQGTDPGNYDGSAEIDYATKAEYGLFLDENHPNANIAAIFTSTGGAADLGVRPTRSSSTIRRFRNDVMAGAIVGRTHLSDTTIAAFEDMGYNTILTVPEPSQSSLIAMYAIFVCLKRKRTT